MMPTYSSSSFHTKSSSVTPSAWSNSSTTTSLFNPSTTTNYARRHGDHHDHHHDIFIVTTILTVLGLPGNILVIFLILRAKRKRSITTYLLLHLTIADILNLLGSTLVSFMVLLHELHRKKRPTTLMLTITPKIAANFTLALVALGRYCALVKTMKFFFRISKRKNLICLIISWLIGLALSTSITFSFKCKPKYPMCLKIKSPCWLFPRLFLKSLLILLGYVIPLVVVVYCYASILKGLYIDGTVLGEVVTDKSRLNENKALVRALIVVTFVFLLCNLPAIIILTVKHFENIHRRELHQIAVILGCLSSILNRFVYGMQSRNYLSQVKELFYRKQDEEGATPPPVVFQTRL